MAEIVLFGATGYTGRLTARAMVARGLAPVLAGRNRAALKVLAAELGGLSIRVADVAEPVAVRKLVKAGDVLVSTVGPFARYGKPALDAALAGKAHYLDSTGEPAFIRQVFQEYGGRVQATGKAFVTAFGYDYVPGHTAAAAALHKAGKKAVRVDIGYFVMGKIAVSQGTFASLGGALLEPGIAFNNGAQQPVYGGLKTRSFSVDGKILSAISVPGSECIALPASYPQLMDVNVYLGLGAASKFISGFSRAQALLFHLPLYKRGMAWIASRFVSEGVGPSEASRASSGAYVVAIAYDVDGKELAVAELRGVNAYTYTANMLAWGAEQALTGKILGSGALGPVAAFGREALIQGNIEAGLALTVR